MRLPKHHEMLSLDYHSCGDTALNMLGLSTQVTAGMVLYRDGPYKTYEWDKTKIELSTGPTKRSRACRL